MVLPQSWNNMFTLRYKKYTGTFLNKPILKRVWLAMPKFVYSEIWLARNKANFQHINTLSKFFVAKAHGLLSKAIQIKGKKGHNIWMLEQERRD